MALLTTATNYVLWGCGAQIVCATFTNTQQPASAIIPGAVIAFGGVTSRNNQFVSHVYNASGQFTVQIGGSIKVLLVGGGAGGGSTQGGGGGAGNVRIICTVVTPGTYCITVGAGGGGSLATYNTYFYGYPGPGFLVPCTGPAVAGCGGRTSAFGFNAYGGSGGSFGVGAGGASGSISGSGVNIATTTTYNASGCNVYSSRPPAGPCAYQGGRGIIHGCQQFSGGGGGSRGAGADGQAAAGGTPAFSGAAGGAGFCGACTNFTVGGFFPNLSAITGFTKCNRIAGGGNAGMRLCGNYSGARAATTSTWGGGQGGWASYYSGGCGSGPGVTWGSGGGGGGGGGYAYNYSGQGGGAGFNGLVVIRYQGK